MLNNHNNNNISNVSLPGILRANNELNSNNNKYTFINNKQEAKTTILNKSQQKIPLLGSINSARDLLNKNDLELSSKLNDSSSSSSSSLLLLNNKQINSNDIYKNISIINAATAQVVNATAVSNNNQSNQNNTIDYNLINNAISTM
jgi:hypothetical protein